MQSLLAIVALAGSIANIPDRPQWQNDYRTAALAAEGKKPLAVFVGSGVNGWEQVAKDGGFDAKVAQLLKDKYVCVYVDTKTTSGTNLAKQFAVDGKGLVISDKVGKTQAFYHNGDLSHDLLVKALERYADCAESQGTETITDLAPPPVYQPATRFQNIYPTSPNFAPAGFSPSFGGAPNGGCLT
jgi:hypothetical protein